MTAETTPSVATRQIGHNRGWRGRSSGMWAWLAQRIAAIALVPLIVIHVVYPYRLITQFLLIVVVVFHGLLGIRVLLIEVGVGARREKLILGVVMVLGLAIIAAMGRYLL